MLSMVKCLLYNKQANKYDNYDLQITNKLKVQRLVKYFYRFSIYLVLISLLFVTSIASGNVDNNLENETSQSNQSSDATISQTTSTVSSSSNQTWTALISIGDSLVQGTMDATNNYFNSWHAYPQQVSNSIGQEILLGLKQPYFDLQENRIFPFQIPTNLGVDGADIFSIEGKEYHKRVGADEPFVSTELLCNEISPDSFGDKYDKVLFPINIAAGQPVSVLDSAVWLINELPVNNVHDALIIFWTGNNDSSLAALGAGGKNPEYQPIPYDVISSDLNPLLSLLLGIAEAAGVVSFDPYTQSAIERNLTEQQHFLFQYFNVLNRLIGETASSGVNKDIFILTLPYYSAVGYLFDSEDIENYLKKINAGYSVPSSFKRVTPSGQPITNPLMGDRISLLTFGMMYALLSTGHTVNDVNQVLEINGQQRDGIVLSEEEQQFIMSRIDEFNEIIKAVPSFIDPNIHVVDIGQFLNNVLTGQIPITINGRVFSRKWIRGGGFSFDGVHPSYTGHALIADYVLYHINSVLGLNAPFYDLSEIMMYDPYIDWDEDGWAPGPGYEGEGITKLLFLFKDPDDSDSNVQAELPPDIWDIISDVLLRQVIDIPFVQEEATRLGIKPLD